MACNTTEVSGIQINDLACIYCEMMTKISLVNIHHLLYNEKKDFLFVMRSFRIYSLNSFQRYHAAVLATVMLYSTPSVLIYLINSILLKRVGTQMNKETLVFMLQKDGFTWPTYSYRYCGRLFFLLALNQWGISGWAGPRWLNTARICASLRRHRARSTKRQTRDSEVATEPTRTGFQWGGAQRLKAHTRGHFRPHEVENK